MAPMASSDSEVKTCSKTCLKNYESLKKQYDDLLAKQLQTKFESATYKRGLDTVEAQLSSYIGKNEVLFSEEQFNTARPKALVNAVTVESGLMLRLKASECLVLDAKEQSVRSYGVCMKYPGEGKSASKEKEKNPEKSAGG
ncbi:hypothetical protein Tco_0524729 [Tanacetum coccineum]